MSLVFLLVLILGTNVSFATTVVPSTQNGRMSVHEAINKAGYQGMLTQRIAKSYMAIVCNVDNEQYKAHLRGSTSIFERNLAELDASAPNEAVRTQIHHIGALWQEYKFIYSDVYNEANALTVLKFNDELLEACNDVVHLLEQYVVDNVSDKDKDEKVNERENGLATIINVSGRQRMFTQRILLFSLTNTYSIGDKTTQMEYLRASINTFEISFRELKLYAGNTEQIDQELLVSSRVWIQMKKQLNLILSSEKSTEEHKEELVEIMKLSEQILFSFDEIVFLYERESNTPF
jgi:hypothetical protein